MSKRLEKFESYADHGWLKKSYSKLSNEERMIVRSFIEKNDQMSRADFEHLVNRMFIDKPSKPKNWTIILEMLVNCNSAKADQ